MSLHPASELHEPEVRRKPSRLGQLIGWVLVPLVVAAALVGAGAHLGATQPDAWYTRTVRYVFGP